MTERQQEILARLRKLYEAQKSAVTLRTPGETEDNGLTGIQLEQYEWRGHEIERLNRELVQSLKPLQRRTRGGLYKPAVRAGLRKELRLIESGE